MSSVKETSGAHAGAVSAMVSASLTPITSPASKRPQGIAEPAEDHGREDDADPRVDLGRRQRVDQRDEGAGHAGERGAETREHESQATVIHAERGGDLRILRSRPGAPSPPTCSGARPT